MVTIHCDKKVRQVGSVFPKVEILVVLLADPIQPCFGRFDRLKLWSSVDGDYLTIAVLGSQVTPHSESMY